MRPAAARAALVAIATVVVLQAATTPAAAHQIDEYLQATLVTLDKGRVGLEVRLTPGVEVFPKIRATIDADGDGVVSDAEQRAYAARVLGDLSLAVDGKGVPLRLTESTFPTVRQMEEGLGDIVLTLDADAPADGSTHSLVFENRHTPQSAAYLANCLFPRDPDLRVTGQHRSYDQSRYELAYAQAAAPAAHASVQASAPAPTRPPSPALWPKLRIWLASDALAVAAGLVLVWWRRRQARASGRATAASTAERRR